MFIEVPLRDVCVAAESGFACAKTKLVQVGTPHLRPFNVGTDGRLSLDEVYQVPPNVVPNGKGHLREGDLLFNNTNSTDLVGKTAYVASDMKASWSNHVTRIRINEKRCLPQFVGIYLHHLWRSGCFKAKCTQWVSQAAINGSMLAAIQIPLPPLDEQRRIVDVLDHALSIRRLREQAQAKAREIIPALFLDMFGDPATNTKGWKRTAISELVVNDRGAIRTGPFGSQLHHSEFVDKGIPVLGIDNVVTNKFRWAKPRFIPEQKYKKFKKYQVFANDVIITIMGTIGRCCVVPNDLPECMSTKHLCVMTPNCDVVHPIYLWATLLFDPSVRAQTRVRGQGQMMEGLNLTIVKGLKIRVPDMSLQEPFAQNVRDVEAFSEAGETAINYCNNVQASLLHQVFGIGNRREVLVG